MDQEQQESPLTMEKENERNQENKESNGGNEEKSEQENEENKEIRLVTHSGRFHADEVSAVALLLNYFTNRGKEVIIVRTRDSSNFRQGDILIDVGLQYDPENYKFDHHQKSFKDTWGPTYEIPLSSVGLIWRHYGSEIVSMYIDKNSDKFDNVDNFPETVVEEIKNTIYNKLILEIDAHDNGVVTDKLKFNLAELVASYNGDTSDNDNQDMAFVEAVEMVGKIFEVKFRHLINAYFNFKKDLEYVKTLDLSGPYVLVKNDIATAFKCVTNLDPEAKIKFIIFEDSEKGEFSVRTRRKPGNTFESICPLADEESIKALLGDRYSSEVIFVHKALFIAKTKTLQACIDIINLSLEIELKKPLETVQEITSVVESTDIPACEECPNCKKNNTLTNVAIGVELFCVGLAGYGIYRYLRSE